MTEQIGTLIGPYRLLELIGQGGMAKVYRAYQAGLDRTVALKILPDYLVGQVVLYQRFQQEAQVISRLEHPHIVPVHDYGQHAGVPYLVMRYIQSANARDLLAFGPQSPAATVRVIRAVAAGLDYAHSQGILHRDVKPSNVLIDQHGHPYLADFGLAKVLEASLHLTGSSGLKGMGTPAYMAPELQRGHPASVYSDVYALGVMIFELLTGDLPFRADNPIAVAFRHVNDPVPSARALNPDVPPAVDIVLARALAKEPEARYPSAGALAQALAAAVPGQAEAAVAGFVEQARSLATVKSAEAVTQEVRREVGRFVSQEVKRQVVRVVPLVLGLLLLAGVASGLVLANFGGQAGPALTATLDALAARAAVQATGEAQLALDRTAVNQLLTEVSQRPELQPTVDYLEDRLNASAATLTALPVPATNTAAPAASASGTPAPSLSPAQATTRAPGPRASATRTAPAVVSPTGLPTSGGDDPGPTATSPRTPSLTPSRTTTAATPGLTPATPTPVTVTVTASPTASWTPSRTWTPTPTDTDTPRPPTATTPPTPTHTPRPPTATPTVEPTTRVPPPLATFLTTTATLDPTSLRLTLEATLTARARP